MTNQKFPGGPYVKVRAKLVFVVSELDPTTRESEEGKQSTVRFEITDEMTEATWNILVAQLKAGVLVPVFN